MAYTEIVDKNTGQVLGRIDEINGTVEMTEEWAERVQGTMTSKKTKKKSSKSTGIKSTGRRPAGSGGKSNTY